MIKIDIPGRFSVNLKYAVFDMNGTLTVDGKISEKVKEKIKLLSEKLKIFILTADTFGTAKDIFKNLPVILNIIDKKNGQDSKLQFIEKIGSKNCVAFGNGFNDIKMLAEAAIGICVIGEEGACSKTILNSDICVYNIISGIDLLLNKKRLIASLRK